MAENTDLDTRIDASKKMIKELEENIEKEKKILTTLNKTKGEIQPLLDKYKELDITELEQYISNKERMIEAVLTEEDKVVVSEKIKNVNDEIDAKENFVHEKEEVWLSTIKALNYSEKSLKEKEDECANLKTAVNNIKDLRKKIEEEDEKNNTKAMHFLTIELKKIVNNTDIEEETKFKKKLQSALESLEHAKDDLKEKENKKKDSEIKFKEEIDKLNSLKKNRRENVLKGITG